MNRNRKIFGIPVVLVAALVAVLSLGACASNQTAGEAVDDAAITAKVKAKLLADPQIKAFHIDVDTVNGIVTLNGEVASSVAKQEAEKLARLTEGVKQVNNVIQVAGQPVPAPPAGSR